MKRKPLVNPYGETKSEFIDKYNQIPNIAEMCWFFGVRPERLKEELEILLSDKEVRKDEHLG